MLTRELRSPQSDKAVIDMIDSIPFVERKIASGFLNNLKTTVRDAAGRGTKLALDENMITVESEVKKAARGAVGMVAIGTVVLSTLAGALVGGLMVKRGRR